MKTMIKMVLEQGQHIGGIISSGVLHFFQLIWELVALKLIKLQARKWELQRNGLSKERFQQRLCIILMNVKTQKLLKKEWNVH